MGWNLLYATLYGSGPSPPLPDSMVYCQRWLVCSLFYNRMVSPVCSQEMISAHRKRFPARRKRFLFPEKDFCDGKMISDRRKWFSVIGKWFLWWENDFLWWENDFWSQKIIFCDGKMISDRTKSFSAMGKWFLFPENDFWSQKMIFCTGKMISGPGKWFLQFNRLLVEKMVKQSMVGPNFKLVGPNTGQNSNCPKKSCLSRMEKIPLVRRCAQSFSSYAVAVAVLGGKQY